MPRTFTTACITGGAGFIGSALARRLVARGMEVRVLDDLSVGRAQNVPEGARLVEGSILDAARCREAFAGCDVVFHLAARVSIRSSFEHVVDDTSCNVVGSATVLHGAVRAGTVRKIVVASTMGVYADSPAPAPILETHSTEAASPYGISKLAMEQLTHRVAGTAGLESVALRLFNTYGVGQRLSPYVGVITIFVNQLRGGQRPTIFGDGRQVRDFVHVDDVASAFALAMDAPVTGETMNIGTGQPRTVQQVYEAIARVLGSDIRPVYTPAVPGELRYAFASIEKARRLIGYEPGRRFEEALPAVVSEIVPDAVGA